MLAVINNWKSIPGKLVCLGLTMGICLVTAFGHSVHAASGAKILDRHGQPNLRTTLPDGRQLDALYYGSGHLHQINLDGRLISDIERDALHRETQRTQGRLIHRTQYDPLSRALARTSRPVHTFFNETLPEGLDKHYRYDPDGELTDRADALFGHIQYRHDPTGRILAAETVHAGRARQALHELHAYDAAANLVTPHTNAGYVRHNRIRVLEDKRYDYDAHGRVTEKRIGSHTVIRFKWNSEHQLIETATERNGARQYSQYTYDALGRRIGRNDAFGESEFLWDGMRLLQERRNHRTSTYVYQPGSHEPLARIDDVDAGYRLPEARADVYHFHNHINGAPEELTNEAGEIVWQGRYGSWGNLALQRVEARLAPERGREGVISPQPLRMQGQYEDVETGLYYNTFRYYDPDIGRFISEDPIGLWGGTNLYQFAPNADGWVDPWGWVPCVNGGKPPKFGNFKDHARRHGGAAGMSSAQYKLNAMSHSRNAQLNVKFRHNGQEKMAHVSRIPDSDMLVFTSTTRSGGRIFTHMPEGVSTGYLNNLGITLPKGF